MPSFTNLLALASGASASAILGMNYASTNGDGTPRTKSDFESYFKTAASLAGTSNINSARLYTMVQGGTKDVPIEAIEAAINTQTTLLLGLWSSGTTFNYELKALNSAIETYGDKLTDVVVGISVGSEDLYRNSPAGIAAGSYVGSHPEVIVDYIQQVRKAVDGTALKDTPIGHVDTWTAWTNSSNQAVTDNCDFVGFNGFPFWQNTDDNKIENGRQLFVESVERTKAAVGDKPVWITETGWPVSYNATDDKPANTFGNALASVDNAKTYWQEVGCGLIDITNTWWYILSETGASPDFSVSESNTKSQPLFDMSCPSNVTPLFSDNNNSSNSTSTNSTSGNGSGSTSTGASSSGSGSTAGSTSGNAASNTASSLPSSANSNMASLGAMVLAMMAAVMTL
jgi:glucan endo-1,3-beta-D-glucosidase